MDYPINIPGFENQTLLWRTGTWKNSFVANGQILKGEGKKRNEFRLPDDSGEEQLITTEISFLDPVPVVLHKGERYNLAPPISMGKKIFAGILHVPLFGGGAIGGGLAAVGFMVSLSLFRSEKPPWLQYLLVFGCSALAWTLYLMAAGGIRTLTS